MRGWAKLATDWELGASAGIAWTFGNPLATRRYPWTLQVGAGASTPRTQFTKTTPCKVAESEKSAKTPSLNRSADLVGGSGAQEAKSGISATPGRSHRPRDYSARPRLASCRPLAHCTTDRRQRSANGWKVGAQEHGVA